MRKRRILSLLLAISLLAAMIPALPALADDYSLVWSDEFDGAALDRSNWNYEIGVGDNGWGNNEQEYYTDRAENIRVAGGHLIITARCESYGGRQFTSARIKTQGLREFTYGKIEARMKMPVGQGIWPAFWMLGGNIGDVGWPACGEIDIMEHVNSDAVTHGTIHWEANGHAEYGGSSGSLDVTQFHTYSVEWTDQYIRWFVDGVQFHEANIANSINSTEEFHRPHFILFNLAVGGNWPGAANDSTPFPAEMAVDYVRVYQKGASSVTSQIPGRVEAENYSSMYGVDREDCSEGGQDVGWIDAGDWMDYPVNVASAGTYRADFRLAGKDPDGALQLQKDGAVLGSVTVPNTGDWQNWQTASAEVYLPAGEQTLRVYSTGKAVNLNWIEFTKADTQPDLVVADIRCEPENPQAGDEVTFRAVIRNDGSGATPAVKHGLSIFVDGTQVNWCDTHLTSLAPGQSATLVCNGGPQGKATWTAAEGTHTVGAFIDDVSLIAESNETNNTMDKSFTVSPKSQGSTVVYTSGEYKLTIEDPSGALADAARQKLVDTYFAVYPAMSARFNTGAAKEVVCRIDTGYDGVAYTSGTSITISSNWLLNNPNDTDCFTHELMHVAQGYPGYDPVWLVEGIADYARNRYGLYNEAGGWSLPDYASGQKYTDSYRVTARFLLWCENRVKADIVEGLDRALRANSYSADTWVQLTGKTVDALWSEYVADPSLERPAETPGIVSGETYVVYSKASGKAATADGGGNLMQSGYRGGDAQRFRFDYLGSGYYKIVNPASGKVVSVENGGTADWTNICVSDDTGADSQQWKITVDGDSFALSPKHAPAMAMDLALSSQEDGGNIHLYTPNGSTAQRWKLEAYEDPGTDLIITDVRAAASAVRKKPVSFNIFVKNAGARATLSAVPLEADVYIDDRLIETVTAENVSIQPGGTVMLQTGNWQAIYGTHTVRVVLNPRGTAPETDVANNRRCALVRVADI